MKQREKERERGGEGEGEEERERERDTERLEAQVGDFRESRAVSFSRSEREEERTSIRERERKKQATRGDTSESGEPFLGMSMRFRTDNNNEQTRERFTAVLSPSWSSRDTDVKSRCRPLVPLGTERRSSLVAVDERRKREEKERERGREARELPRKLNDRTSIRRK